MTAPTQMLLLDRNIRSALVEHLADLDPSSAVFHELPLTRGVRRADLVVVNGHISGFEIKSERDSLIRLRGQASQYDLICEYSTIVVAKRHVSDARNILPSHWGIMTAEAQDRVSFKLLRKPKPNRNLDKWALIRLMWKDECIDVVRRHRPGVARNLPVIHYWESLQTLELSLLTIEVRDALKRREARRSGRPRTQGGD